MASYLDAANTFAKQQADLLRQQLASYYTNLTGQKTEEEAAAQARKQALLDTIAANENKLTTSYNTEAQGLFTNKMMQDIAVKNQLERLGVANQGYGVSQVQKVGADYTKGLGTLGGKYQEGLTDIGLDKSKAQSAYNEDLANIGSQYSQNKLSLDKYINETAQSVYDDSYNKYVEDKQYQDSLAQQAYENRQSAVKAAKTTPKTYTNTVLKPEDYGSYTFVKSGKNMIYTTATGNKYTLAIGINPYIGGSKFHSDLKGADGKYDASKAFGNGYQPNNIAGAKLSASPYKVGDLFGDITSSKSGISLGNQTVWQTGGKYYIWDGAKNKYEDVTTNVKNKLKQSGTPLR